MILKQYRIVSYILHLAFKMKSQSLMSDHSSWKHWFANVLQLCTAVKGIVPRNRSLDNYVALIKARPNLYDTQQISNYRRVLNAGWLRNKSLSKQGENKRNNCRINTAKNTLLMFHIVLALLRLVFAIRSCLPVECSGNYELPSFLFRVCDKHFVWICHTGS